MGALSRSHGTALEVIITHSWEPGNTRSVIFVELLLVYTRAFLVTLYYSVVLLLSKI